MSFSQPLLGQVFRDMHRAFSLLDEPLTNVSRRALSARYPPTDIVETKTGYELHAEIPGFQKEDIDIHLPDDHTLVIGGNQESSTTSHSTPAEPSVGDEQVASSSTDVMNSPYWWKSERITGSFKRAFTFPHSINGDAIKANYKDGILIINVPKSEKAAIRIPIE
ncbi:HSP20-like chaperone [Absidia repens]|uniref:HSP20-like chaperone n=1 Tax=Absidia repens TaxID=90262 RepID=A0A1X2IBP0_9FUNG|nr:HSP20-like chaperone [Absidia repens]